MGRDAAESALDLTAPEMAFGEHVPGLRVEQHRDPMVVPAEQAQIEVDVADLDGDAPLRRQRRHDPIRLVAERAALPGEEPDRLHGARAIFSRPMRPFTAIVLIALLVLLVGAFVIRMQSIGFTP